MPVKSPAKPARTAPPAPRTKRQDPRIGRTLKLLGNSLRELILEHGYSSLSVQDITDHADVSRTTFYLHFKDKDDLLFATMEQIYGELGRKPLAALQAVTTLEEFAAIACDPADYQHVAENAEFYRIMLGKQGSAAFIQRVTTYLTSVFHEELVQPLLPANDDLPIPTEVIAAFFAGAQVGLINWWLHHDLSLTPAQMAKMQYQLTFEGLSAMMPRNFTDAHSPSAAVATDDSL